MSELEKQGYRIPKTKFQLKKAVVTMHQVIRELSEIWLYKEEEQDEPETTEVINPFKPKKKFNINHYRKQIKRNRTW